jgi:hypothetical protein
MKNTLISLLNTLTQKTVLYSILFLLAFVTLLMYGREYGQKAGAKEAPPAEVMVMQEWLQKNVPTIKRLKAELEPLQQEKSKRVEALAAFNYEVNWETLQVFTLPQ